jgi:hypothetical protein
MPSAISTPTYQALAGNIFNADGSTPIYSLGAWTFKNSSAVTTFAISDAGAVAVGPSTGLGTSAAAYNRSYGSVRLGSASFNTAVVCGADAIEVGSNYYRDGSNTAKAIASVRSSLFSVNYNDGADATKLFTFSTNSTVQTADTAFSGTWVELGSCTKAGAWMFNYATTPTTNTTIAGWGYSGSTKLSLKTNNSTGVHTWDNATGFSTNFSVNGTVMGSMSAAGAWANIAGGSWGTISDSRLKKNVVPLHAGLSTILALNPVSYDWRDENVSELRPTTHFIAQEVELVNPKWVMTGNSEKITENGIDIEIKNCKQVNLDASFNAYLVKAIQEQQSLIVAQQSQIDSLLAAVAALGAK